MTEVIPTSVLPFQRGGSPTENEFPSSPSKGEVATSSLSSPSKGEGRVGVDHAEQDRFDRTPLKTKRARELRQAMTPAEAKLWSRIRNNQLEGLGFRRQHPMSKYILDFYCASLKLAVELDGGQHNEPANIARDKTRDVWFASKGIETLRMWNNDVLTNIMSSVETVWRVAIKRKAMMNNAHEATA